MNTLYGIWLLDKARWRNADADADGAIAAFPSSFDAQCEATIMRGEGTPCEVRYLLTKEDSPHEPA